MSDISLTMHHDVAFWNCYYSFVISALVYAVNVLTYHMHCQSDFLFFRFSQITREGEKAMVLRPILSVFIVTCCHFLLFTLPRFFVSTIGQYEDVRYRVNIQYVYSMPNEVSVLQHLREHHQY